MTQTPYKCPECKSKSLLRFHGQYIDLLQCMSCGFSISVQEWNELTKKEKDKLRGKKRRFKIF